MAHKPFAGLVRDKRKSLDLTQPELAKKIGVSYATVNRVENGVMVCLETAKRFNEVLSLGLSEEALMRHIVEDQVDAPTEAEKALLRAFRRKDVNTVLSIVRRHITA